MNELLEKLRKEFPDMRLNPQKPVEEVQMRGSVTRASRVIIKGKTVDILEQKNLISVWVNGSGSIKETTVDEAFSFVQRTLV